MNKKIIIAVILVIIIVIVGVLVYLYYYKQEVIDQGITAVSKIISREDKEQGDQKQQQPIKQDPVKEEIKRIVHTETEIVEASITDEDLKRMAAAFSERFGSYSNQSNYANIKDLKLFMTERMQAWSDNYIKQIKVQGGTDSIYYGITTKAIFQEVKEYDDDVGNAEILVKTRRQEATGTMTNTSSFYQDIVIAFVKNGNSWKVDSASWQ